MKTIKKNVYYCGFCKKHGLSASAMSIHEQHCTLNPNRECRLCDRAELVNNLPELIAIIPDIKQYTAMELGFETILIPSGEQERVEKELRKESGNCPACILAALRQSKDGRSFMSEFNFKEESKKFFKDTEPDEPNYYY